jgi:hypothetical protein
VADFVAEPLRSRANRDSVEVKRPSTERFDDGAVQE